MHNQQNGASSFRAAGGTLVYETRPPDDVIAWFDRSGRQGTPLTTPGLFAAAAISPDGRRIVAVQRDRRTGTTDLWLYAAGVVTPRQLTRDVGSEGALKWAEDSRQIAYNSDTDGPPDVFVLDVESGARPTRVFQTSWVDRPIGWLSNDRLLVRSVGGREFSVVSASGDVIESGYAGAKDGRVSPDRQWVAYTSQATSRTEVYVSPFGRTGPAVAVSHGGGQSPRWSGDSKTLYFSSGNAMFEVSLTLGAVASAGPQRQLFTVDRDIDTFDVMPDGQRFLIVRRPPDDFLPVHVLVNWPAKLRR
jgi:Tol biopolymer transport system component